MKDTIPLMRATVCELTADAKSAKSRMLSRYHMRNRIGSPERIRFRLSMPKRYRTFQIDPLLTIVL